MKSTYPWPLQRHADEVEGPLVTHHTCGCTPQGPCPKARAIFDRNGRTYPGDLWHHLNGSFRVPGERPNADSITVELQRLRRLNRARRQRGAA